MRSFIYQYWKFSQPATFNFQHFFFHTRHLSINFASWQVCQFVSLIQMFTELFYLYFVVYEFSILNYSKCIGSTISTVSKTVYLLQKIIIIISGKGVSMDFTQIWKVSFQPSTILSQARKDIIQTIICFFLRKVSNNSISTLFKHIAFVFDETVTRTVSKIIKMNHSIHPNTLTVVCVTFQVTCSRMGRWTMWFFENPCSYEVGWW